MCRQHYDTVCSLPAVMNSLILESTHLVQVPTQCDNFKLGIELKALQRHIKS